MSTQQQQQFRGTRHRGRGSQQRRHEHRREVGNATYEANQPADLPPPLMPPPPQRRATAETEATRPREPVRAPAPARQPGFANLDDPSTRPRFTNEVYVADQHGFVDLVSSVWRDLCLQDHRLVESFSESEFVLANYWILLKYELEVISAYNGLPPTESDTLTFLRHALPTNMPIVEEVYQYLLNYGRMTTATGVSIIPTFVTATATNDANTTGLVAVNWRQHRISPGQLARVILHQAVPANADPFAADARRTLIPGGSPFLPMHPRRQAAAAAFAVNAGADEAARTQVIPLTLQAYLTFMVNVESKRMVRATWPTDYAGSLAQIVVANPVGGAAGGREVGYEFDFGMPLTVMDVQAGRLFRYQRRTARAKTHRDVDNDVDLALTQSSVWSHLYSMDARRVESLTAFGAMFASNHRK